MKEFDVIEKRIALARQKIYLLNGNHGEFQKVLKEWNVIDTINEFQKVLQKIDDKCKLIKEKIERKLVKLYFFGRFSSGKSTIINGLIRKDLFLAGPEHTTNCFVHIEKSENSCYKIILEENEVGMFNDFEQARDEIENLSTSKIDNGFENDKSIKVLVPFDEDNTIMKENIELIDSPGSGNKESITKCITEYAKDADIFVFVLMHDVTEDDEKFFEFQTENSTKPDIFVLINKWNDTDRHRPNKIKESENNLLNKCDQLIMKMSANNAKNIRDRTYFISGNEICDIRICNNEQYLHNENIKRRYESFEKFESKLSEYVQNPIEHKYQRYSQELKFIAKDLSNEYQNFSLKILTTLNSNSLKIMKEKCEKSKEHIDYIKKKCEDVEKKCIENIKCKVTKMMDTLKIDDSNEIGENIRKHYMNIDEDINKLYTDLDERLSIIKENYFTENTNCGEEVKNEIIKYSKFGEKDFQIETNMEIITYPKSKTAVKVLSFIPIVGFAATNILLKRIDYADEHHSNKTSLVLLENEVHAQDDEKIRIVKYKSFLK